MRSIVATFLALASVVGAAACDSTTTPGPAQKSVSSARTLGMFSRSLAGDEHSQARAALEQDAFRREARFRDAVEPGLLFRSTRVEQSELEENKWTPDAEFQLGAQLFHVTFTKPMGFGGADLPALARFHRGRRGGPDARKCASCHWRGGIGGAGDGADNAYLDGDGDRQSSAIERNPPPLHGAGLVELLAAEMTRDLQAMRDDLVRQARATGAPVTGAIVTKGIDFGLIDVRADGTVSTDRLHSVDADLVVRPFGWKGSFATIRDAVEDALNVHHGMQSDYLVAHGSPDRIGDKGGDDPDGDQVTHEITEGQTSVLTLFVAMQETPQVIVPSGFGVFVSDDEFVSSWEKGKRTFERIGCATCHVPAVKLDSTVFHLPSRMGGKDITVDLAKEGAEPRITPRSDGSGVWLELYSDLKRHDMGPELAEARADRGVPEARFLTRPLWGLARSRPYLHDGRTPLVHEAIVAHGGEALGARDAFVMLKPEEQSNVRSFLSSLARARRLMAP